MKAVKHFDVIVVGGGHAGTEAALASARLGQETLLLTHNLDLLGQMSCNPAIGGIGKGHLVKEIDALGGAMAEAADEAGIQFRRLNASKGPAVRATRAQTDRVLYRNAIRKRLESQAHLTLFQQAVDDIVLEGDCVKGVVTQMGLYFSARSVVLTVGTFLGGRIHVGDKQSSGGRAGDSASIELAARLRAMDFPVGRLKTGTPPRLDGRTLNYDKMTPQPGDTPRPVFSYLHTDAAHPEQRPCFITQTTEKTHQIIRDNIHTSAMYSGNIEGVGPRYCPSIEDKVERFADKLSHQIFVEPEGLSTSEIYPNGISTSLSFEVQLEFIRTIVGFENAHITRPGYAIEYDYFDPRNLTCYLQTKGIDNLFLAGQINGTTGYEEAAAQGLLAGLNAARMTQGKPMWSPRRDEAYLGVLVDDLITQGTLEPYRMFTSRAEYRLLLREDNADLRLTEIGRELGLVDEVRWQAFSMKRESIENAQAKLKNAWIRKFEPPVRTSEYLKRPEINYQTLKQEADTDLPDIAPQVEEQLEIQSKYAGYIERQSADIERLKKHESTRLPNDLDYEAISGLSTEVVQKLKQVRPHSLGQAGRISGVTPAALSLLLVHLKKQCLLA